VLLCGLWVTGAGLADKAATEVPPEFGKKYGEDIVYLGWKAGVDAVILGMGENIKNVFPVDYYGKSLDSLPMMNTVKQLRDIPGSSKEDEALVVLDYPKATAVLSAGWWALPDTGPGTGEALLNGPKGILRRNLGTVTCQRGRDPAGPAVADAAEKPVASPRIARERQNGVAHFVDCIRTGKAVEAPHTAALNVTVSEVIDAAYESIRTGRAITLP